MATRQIDTEISRKGQSPVDGGLGQSQDLMRALLHDTDAVVYVASPEGRLLLANPAAETLFQAPLHELLNRHVRDLFPREVADLLWAHDQQVIASRRAMESEQVVPQPDGSHTYVITRFPLLDPQGQPYAVGGIATDITERWVTEQHLLAAQRMDALGRLAGRVAHDFNNLLTVINGYCSLLLQRTPEGLAGRKEMLQIRQAGEGAAALTQQLLAFSRKQLLTPETVNLNDVIRRQEHMLCLLLGDDIDLGVHLAQDLNHIVADPAQMQQVFLNLAANARDAMPDGGRLAISTLNRVLSPGEICSMPGLAPGNYVVVSFSDTGCGMDEASKARIFEPFFTTKPKDKGAGMGLSTAFGIVRQSGGYLAVESAPGAGSVFSIWLPKAAEPARESPVRDETHARSFSGREAVLLVEDEECVRSYATEVLGEYGYRVTAVPHPALALREFRRQPGAFDLVVTDVVMPAMNGREMFDEMRALRPGLKVLFLSGYSEDVIEDRGVLEPGVEFLLKPFTPEMLARRVRNILGEVRKSTNILIVDDEEPVRQTWREFLEQEGYAVRELADGRHVVETCRNTPMDLVLIDLIMPDKEGIETIIELRRSFPKLPIIAASGGGNVTCLNTAAALGASATFSKPFNFGAVLSKIRELTKSPVTSP